jgi:ABC-type nickel/cobalt efflux system permease component RcnA
MGAAAVAVLGFGFVLGMRHATDPDHVIAVSTIVSREKSIARAATIGVLWGCGHTLTILLVGSGIVLFGLAIPARVGLTMEFSVGLMLILLGALNLSGALGWLSPRFSRAVHRHGHPGSHFHSDARDSFEDSVVSAEPLRNQSPPERLGVFHTLRPVAVGIVHGLAGSAAVALLVLTTIREPKFQLLYLLIFGVGTILGMMLITAALAVPFSVAATRFTRCNQALITASGLISLAFGLFLAYQIGVVGGLFTAHPSWTPQ